MEGGKGRGVFSEFRLARVSCCRILRRDCYEEDKDGLTRYVQYCFRMLALEGSLPGVKKASW